MALIAFAADKGSPGVTTTALSLAAVWPRRALLAELDPSGGDIVLRLRGPRQSLLSPERGLLSLAVAARRKLTTEALWQHIQMLDGGLEVLIGLATPEQAGGLGALWRPLTGLLAGIPGVDVLADCGRLYPGTPAMEVLKGSALTVLVTTPEVDAVAHLRARATSLCLQLGTAGFEGVPVGVLVVADPKETDGPREVESVLASSGVPVRVLGRIARDEGAAAMLRGQWGGRLSRSLLVRSAREVATVLTNSLDNRGLVGAL
ncbi:MAG: hypothetical protein DLM59_08975 [Pseudonocardiales bacterium]|nr:MAG: hypothetical protein DLM59_08975 [Pseudonocardiales bacterium]